MQLRKLLRQLVGAVALLYVAAAGGELLAARLFDEHSPPMMSTPPPLQDVPNADELTTVPTSAPAVPAPNPTGPSQASVNPHCPVYAIPTTGHRAELTQLLDQLVNSAGVKGSRVHLFVDMTALVADHKLLSQLQQSFGVHIHHRSKQVQDRQKLTQPARPWPPTQTREGGDGTQLGDVDMGKAVGLWYHYAFMLDTMFGAARNSATSEADGQGAHISAAPFGTEYVAILEDDVAVSVDIDGYV